MDAERFARTVIENLKGVRFRVAWSAEFRGSALPPCETALALSMLGLSISKQLTFVQEALMAVGTTVHALLCRWLGRTGMLWGHWNCPECGEMKRYVTNSNACDACGSECEYHEVRLFHKGFSGHTDGFLGVEAPQLMTEFKVVEAARRKLFLRNGLPGTYVAQVKSYHYVVGRKTVMQLSPYVPVLIFSRNTISDVGIIVVDCSDAASAFAEYEARYQNAKRAVASRDFDAISKLGKTCPDDRPCPYEIVCRLPWFSETLEELLNQGAISWPRAR